MVSKAQQKRNELKSKREKKEPDKSFKSQIPERFRRGSQEGTAKVSFADPIVERSTDFRRPTNEPQEVNIFTGRAKGTKRGEGTRTLQEADPIVERSTVELDINPSDRRASDFEQQVPQGTQFRRIDERTIETISRTPQVIEVGEDRVKTLSEIRQRAKEEQTQREAQQKALESEQPRFQSRNLEQRQRDEATAERISEEFRLSDERFRESKIGQQVTGLTPEGERTGIGGNPSFSLIGSGEGLQIIGERVESFENKFIIDPIERTAARERAITGAEDPSGIGFEFSKGVVEGLRPSGLIEGVGALVETSGTVLGSEVTSDEAIIVAATGLKTQFLKNPAKTTGEIVGSVLLFSALSKGVKAISRATQPQIQVKGIKGTELGAELLKLKPKPGQPSRSFTLSKGKLTQVSSSQLSGTQAGKTITITSSGQVFQTQTTGLTRISGQATRTRALVTTNQVTGIRTTGGAETLITSNNPIFTGRIDVGSVTNRLTTKTSESILRGQLQPGSITSSGFTPSGSPIDITGATRTELLRQITSPQGVTQISRGGSFTRSGNLQGTGTFDISKNIATTDIIQGTSEPIIKVIKSTSGTVSAQTVQTSSIVATSGQQATSTAIQQGLTKVLPQTTTTSTASVPGLSTIAQSTTGLSLLKIEEKAVEPQVTVTSLPKTGSTTARGLIFDTSSKITQDQGGKGKTSLKLDNTVDLIQKPQQDITQIIDQKQNQQQLLRQTSQTKQQLRQQNIITPTTTTIPPTTNKIVGLPSGSLRATTESDKEGYNTQVRFKGKFVKVNKRALTKSRATKLGTIVVDEASPRSFKVTKASGKASEDTISGFNRLSKFRPAKREQGVLVERRRHAIDSPGERKEITVKGLRTLARQRTLRKTKSTSFTNTKSSLLKSNRSGTLSKIIRR